MIPATVLLIVLLPIPGLAAAHDDGPSSRFELRGSGGWIGFADEAMIHHSLMGVSVRIRLSERPGNQLGKLVSRFVRLWRPDAAQLT